MDKLQLQLHDGIAIDAFTNKTVQRSVYIKSGMREVFIGINTLVEIGDFLRRQGIKTGLPEGKDE